MNRRNFLKLTGLAGITLPFIGTLGAAIPVSSELNDLYSFLESKQLSTPFGICPFKLWPHQKEILKLIHENDKVIIVKGRRIGMSTLLAGYAVWLSHKKPVYNLYCACNEEMEKDWRRMRNRTFGDGEFINITRPVTIKIKTYNLYIADELNLADNYYHGIHALHDDIAIWNEWVFGSDLNDGYYHSNFTPHPGKMIITGGLNEVIVQARDMRAGFKVACYPEERCNPPWDAERMKRHEDYLLELYHTTSVANRELHCNFI